MSSCAASCLRTVACHRHVLCSCSFLAAAKPMPRRAFLFVPPCLAFAANLASVGRCSPVAAVGAGRQSRPVVVGYRRRQKRPQPLGAASPALECSALPPRPRWAGVGAACRGFIFSFLGRHSRPGWRPCSSLLDGWGLRPQPLEKQ